MKYFEFERGPESTAISVPRGLMCYLVQDDRPKYWLAAFSSELEQYNYPLLMLLKETGVLSDKENKLYKRLDKMRELSPEAVKPARDIIVDAYYQEKEL